KLPCAFLRNRRRRESEQLGDDLTWFALQEGSRDDVNRSRCEVPVGVAWRVSSRRGQDIQELREMLGIMIRTSNDGYVRNLAVDLIATRRHCIPEVLLLSEFEKAPQFLMNSHLWRLRPTIRQHPQRLG